MQLIRDAAELPVTPVPGSLSFQRSLQTAGITGYDKNGNATGTITVITDAGGKILTAFPGVLH